ncbi:MAG: DegT/DnrJ/EryC1/StrS family aminotransferase [Cyclobacteriaceae bacterium]
MYKEPLSYNPIDVEGLHKVLLNYQGRNHEEIVVDFEKLASTQLLNRPVVAVSSGTAALHLALAALGIGSGDLVVVPTFSYVASVNPVLYVGAKPVWIDSEETTWNLCPELLEQALREFNPRSKRIKAIIVVHNYGVPADMEKIMSLAKKYKVPVIEDAAEAWGASIKGRPCGTVGNIGVFSFNNNKTVTAFGGGLLTTSNSKWEKRARLLSSQARLPKAFYLFDEVGFNYRMSPLIAAYGLLQLQQADELVARRQEIFLRYCEAFKDHRAISWASPLPGDVASHWLSAFRFSHKSNPQRLFQELSKKGIEVRRGWNPLHTMEHLSVYPVMNSKNSEKLFQEVICLPSGTRSEQCLFWIKKLI